MEKLQRVNLMLERRQREELERRARQSGRSVSELVRAYITKGLSQEDDPQAERLQALENARALKKRVLERRGGKPLTDSVDVIEQVRQERLDELLGH
jgi:hypothetical protein